MVGFFVLQKLFARFELQSFSDAGPSRRWRIRAASEDALPARARWQDHSSFPQVAAHVGHHHADLLDCVAKLLLGAIEFFAPVAPLPFFIHVHPATISRPPVSKIICHGFSAL